MIYSLDDVKKILDEILEKASKDLSEGGPCFFFKNDHIPPKVIAVGGKLESRGYPTLADIINEIKGRL